MTFAIVFASKKTNFCKSEINQKTNFCKFVCLHLLEERDAHQGKGVLHGLQNHLAEADTDFAADLMTAAVMRKICDVLSDAADWETDRLADGLMELFLEN